jgi:hypothetical protein
MNVINALEKRLLQLEHQQTPSQPQATDQRALELLQSSKALGVFFATDEATTMAIAAERVHTQPGVGVGMYLIVKLDEGRIRGNPDNNQAPMSAEVIGHVFISQAT